MADRSKLIFINTAGDREETAATDSLKYASFKIGSYELTETLLGKLANPKTSSAGVGDAGQFVVLDGTGKFDVSTLPVGSINHNLLLNSHNLTTDIDHNGITNTHNLTTDINHDNIGSVANSTAHTAFPLLAGGRVYTGIQAYNAAKVFTADAQIVDKKYVDDQIAGLSSGLMYKGIFDAATPDPDLVNQANSQGDFYKVSVAGTFLGIQLTVGDMIVINKDVASGALVAADIDKIDNTESPDLLREGDLAAGQIFVGNSGGVAVATTLVGDVTIDSSGVSAIGASKVTNSMLAGSIADSKLASDYVQTSEVDGATIEWSGSALRVKADGIKDSHIDFGTGATQVNAADLPVVDAGSRFVATDVEGALAEIYDTVVQDGVAYTAGTGGVTKGDVVYISANNTAVKFSDITENHYPVGIAYSTANVGETFVVASDDSVVTNILSSATAGTKYYWNGSALSTTQPSTSGQYVIQAGFAKNSTDLHTEVMLVKKNS